jgi:transposase
MLSVEDKEQIRRAHNIDNRSKRWIERELGHDRRTINKALQEATPAPYEMSVVRPSPTLGTWHQRIHDLWEQNKTQPRKQRLTASRIFDVIKAEGYGGSSSNVRRHIRITYKAQVRPAVYLLLEFDPGKDGQFDWGEARVIMAGEEVVVQFALLRACYSRRLFVYAYPTQRQECFLDAMMRGFEFFDGVFARVWFDNLTQAVQKILEGRNRKEQRHFTAFRSHCLFESVFCRPAEAHEKGGVENGVGYVQRNFFAPMLEVRNFDELNAILNTACLGQSDRTVAGQSNTIGQAWQDEADKLLPLPIHTFPCCVTVELTLDGYGLLAFETNRYSVPVEQARRVLTVKAYPYTVQIFSGNERIASHPRCYERQQEIIDPVHFLPLLEQRTAAFEHSAAMRKLRAGLPEIFNELLRRLRLDDALGVREFVRVLRLLETRSQLQLEAAVTQALMLGAINRDAIALILRTQTEPTWLPEALPLETLPGQLGLFTHPGMTPDLAIYDSLLGSLLPTTEMAAAEVLEVAHV